MTLILDHVFMFCDPAGKAEIEQLAQFGLGANFGRQHVGHGTANRLVLFEDNYLELIWIDDAKSAHADPMRFPERLALSNGHVFGLGLRVRHGRTDFSSGWEKLELNGLDGGHLRVRPDSFENLALPIVFALVMDDGPLPTPTKRGHPEELFSHPCGATGIRSVELMGPHWGNMSREGLPAEVILENGSQPKMRLELNTDKAERGQGPKTLDLGEKASLCLV